MAYTAASNQYLADLLTSLGTGFLSAPRGGPPLAGLGIGLNTANQMAQQRQQQARQQLQDQLLQSQIDQQQKAQADSERKNAAAKSWLLGQQAPATDSASARNVNPSAGAISSLPPQMQQFVTGMADVAPMEAMQMAGQQLLKEPAKPEPPVVKDFFEGGNVVQKQWDPATGQWSVVGQGARWQPPQPPQLPSDVQEYLFAKKQDSSIGTYGAWKKSQGGESMRYGLNPVYGTKDGKTVILLPNSSGGVAEAPLPDGVTIAPQAQFVDTPTAVIPLDKRTGLAIPGATAVPKDVSGAAEQKTVGEATGTAQATLRNSIASADQAIKNVNELLSDDIVGADGKVQKGAQKNAREWATGATSVFGSLVPGTSGYDYKTRVKQLAGGVFLNAYQQLKGAGAITEVEGGKAEDALARLDTAQSEGAFTQALNDYLSVINTGRERLVANAQGPLNPADVPPPAAVDPSKMNNDDLLKALSQ